jgi:hypothetical protein
VLSVFVAAGQGKDLGDPPAVGRFGLNFEYRFDNGMRIGAAYQHMSNGKGAAPDEQSRNRGNWRHFFATYSLGNRDRRGSPICERDSPQTRSPAICQQADSLLPAAARTIYRGACAFVRSRVLKMSSTLQRVAAHRGSNRFVIAHIPSVANT